MVKIAVIGATGFFGTKAIEGLLKRGVKPEDIVAIFRNECKTGALKEKGVELRHGDYQSKDFGAQVLEGVDKLLFISGFALDPLKRIEDHIAVVRAAKDAKVKHIVYTSLAYPEKSCSGLEQVHLATEHTIKAAGIPYTFLRNTFYTEYTLVPDNLKRAVEDGVLYTLAQGHKINFVCRDDMAEGAAAVLSSEGHENKVYEITAPTVYTYADIAMILSEVTGKEVKCVETTPAEYTAYLDKHCVPPEARIFEPVLIQVGLLGGWAEGTNPALAQLIGAENVKGPKQIVQEMFHH